MGPQVPERVGTGADPGPPPGLDGTRDRLVVVAAVECVRPGEGAGRLGEGSESVHPSRVRRRAQLLPG